MCPKCHMCQKKVLQIMIENISAIAIINHMGGQSHLLTIITKSIDTTSISYQPLCCGRGDISSYKNGDLIIIP